MPIGLGANPQGQRKKRNPAYGPEGTVNSEPVNAYNFSKDSRLMIFELEIFSSIDKIPSFGF
jgi:hypothetical protein